MVGEVTLAKASMLLSLCFTYQLCHTPHCYDTLRYVERGYAIIAEDEHTHTH